MRPSLETISAIITLGLIPAIKFILRWRTINKDKYERGIIEQDIEEARRNRKKE
jgi:hypothetical protein